jgi:hypothetical protein
MAFHRGPKTVTDGLVLYLDAANPKSYPGSGTAWSDLSGNGYTGTLINGPTFSSGNGGSIQFDGTNDYFAASNIYSVNNISGSDSFTFSVLFKLPQFANQRNTDPENYTSLLMKGGYNPSFGISLRYDLPDSGVFTRVRSYSGVRNLALPSIESGYGNPTLSSNTTFNINEWYQIDFTSQFSATTYIFKTYINGIVDSTGTRSDALYPVKYENNNDLTISASPLGGNGIQAPMIISNCKIYNRALSAEEILQNYNATKSRFGL